MPSYDFTASRLAAKGMNPQMSHMGMLELHINELIPGAKEVLMLGFTSIDLPTAQSVQKKTIHYLHGSVNYPGKPESTGDITLTIQDYVDGRQREVLHEWFDKIYDKRTGLGELPSEVKTTAHIIFFNARGETTRTYFVKGIFPLNDPGLPTINFSNSDIVTMSVTLSNDGYELEKTVNP